MDYRELAERQRWTLHQKIDHSVGVIEGFIAGTGNVPCVSYSGGKDSTVLLDIARRYVDRDMKAVFCNTGNEYPEIVRFVRETENVTIIHPEYTVRQVLEKYGFPLISKEQAQGIRQAKTTRSEKLLNIRLHGTDKDRRWTSGKIADKWQYLIAEPFMISEKCCDCLKKRPLARYLRQTGEVPIIGTMAGESRLRAQQYIRRGGCNSFSEMGPASHPLSIWTDETRISGTTSECSMFRIVNCMTVATLAPGVWFAGSERSTRPNAPVSSCCTNSTPEPTGFSWGTPTTA